MAKFRRQHQIFIAEGTTNVLDFIAGGMETEALYATRDWLKTNQSFLNKIKITEVSLKEMSKISALKNPSEVLAVIAIPDRLEADMSNVDDLVLMLDDIRDPGNLGTIIRTADWFGIQHVICSENTVDAYNPKVVQATMGSLARVQVYYQDLNKTLQSKPDYLKVFGAVLEGHNMMELAKPNHGIILIGSEAHGISKELLPLLDIPITIPKYISSRLNSSAESLNASIATAIICYEFRKK
ncbi:MAG: RNA methyltransferase [Bacteroidetes bacterium]|nr:RNA methyltransferase [Bacteroidota bacterium]